MIRHKTLALCVLGVSLSTDALSANQEDIQLGGFFDLEWEQSLSNSGGDQNGSFDLHHLNILSSYRINDRLNFRSHIEWGHVYDSAGGGVLRVEWAFADYKVSDALHIRPGYTLTPFGIYNEIRDSSPTYIRYQVPVSLYRAKKMGGFDFVPKWINGVSFTGNVPVGAIGSFSYNTYITNGTNVSKWNGEADDNFAKGVGTNLNYSPSLNVSLLAAGYYENAPMLDPVSGEVSSVSVPHSMLYGGFVYNGPIQIELEGAIAKRGTQTQVGTHALISYTTKHNIIPYFTYSHLDRTIRRTPNAASQLSLGVTYLPISSLALKVGTLHRLQSQNVDFGQSYTELHAAFTLAF